jgi:hypothetical protein
MIYYRNGLPNATGERGHVKVEGLFNFGAGKLYASGGNGSIYSVDIRTAAAAYIATPVVELHPRKMFDSNARAAGMRIRVGRRATRYSLRPST